jgi:hypothetical protein
MPDCRFMATGKIDGDREAELEAAIRSDPRRDLEAGSDIAQAPTRHCPHPARTEAPMIFKDVIEIADL